MPSRARPKPLRRLRPRRYRRTSSPRLTADVDWQTVGRPKDFPTLGPRKGPRQVQEFFQLVAENEDFVRFLAARILRRGRQGFVLGNYSLRCSRPASRSRREWVHVFTLRDGKVARFREFTDTAKFAEAFAARRRRLALARRFIDEVCNGRMLGVADALFSARSRSITIAGSPWAAKGPAGIKDVIGVYHRGVKDARWDVHSTIETGDTVVTALDRERHAHRRASRHRADQPESPRRWHLDVSRRRRQDRRKLELLGHARHAAAARRGAGARREGGLRRRAESSFRVDHLPGHAAVDVKFAPVTKPERRRRAARRRSRRCPRACRRGRPDAGRGPCAAACRSPLWRSSRG